MAKQYLNSIMVHKDSNEIALIREDKTIDGNDYRNHYINIFRDIDGSGQLILEHSRAGDMFHDSQTFSHYYVDDLDEATEIGNYVLSAYYGEARCQGERYNRRKLWHELDKLVESAQDLRDTMDEKTPKELREGSDEIVNRLQEADMKITAIRKARRGR